MIIGVKRKFIFVANSKTGSTAIESVLATYAEVNRTGSPQRKHISWQKVRQEYAFIFDNEAYPQESFFRFGVVREPADWVLSWYNYRRFKKRGNISKEMSFEDFWESSDWIKNKNQKSHFVDDDGVCRFDLIIPLERLSEASPILFRSLGVKSKRYEIKNKSKGSLRREEVSLNLWNDINNYFREDWEFYNAWNTRFDTVFSEVLERFFPECLAAEEELEAGDGNLLSNIRISKAPCQIVKHAQLMANEYPESSESLFNLRGFVLLNNEYCSKDMSLVVIGASGTNGVDWGLPSAKLLKAFPESTDSGVARFKAAEIRIEPGDVAEVALVESKECRHILFLLENTS